MAEQEYQAYLEQAEEARSLREQPLAQYDVIADEYYDSLLHPTCANFRRASSGFVLRCLGEVSVKSVIMEIGCGRSLVAEILAAKDAALANTILVDRSLKMLRHSQQFSHLGARLIVGDALKLPVRGQQVDALFAVLGDPYNVSELWQELRRIVRTGGRCFFTTPSYEWAHWFRNSINDELSGAAQFLLRDGGRAYVPSHIFPIDEQLALMGRYGWRCEAVEKLGVDGGDIQLSPKIVRRDVALSHVVTGFVLQAV